MYLYHLKLKHGCCWITVYSGDLETVLSLLNILQDQIVVSTYAIYRNNKMTASGTAEYLLGGVYCRNAGQFL